MRIALLFLAAGLLEIGGGYLEWLWLRDQRSALLGADTEERRKKRYFLSRGRAWRLCAKFSS